MISAKQRVYARLAVRMIPRFRWRVWRNLWRYARMVRQDRRSGPDHLGYMPTDVSIWVTNRCNKDCHFCHYVEGLNAKNHRELELTFERFKELVHLPLTRNCLRLGLYGAEPLLNEALPEMIVYGKRRGHLVTVNTNGLLIKKRLNELMNSRPDLLLISYYPEDREQTTEAIALTAPHIPVIVHYMYSEARLGEIEEVIQCAIRYRAWAVKLETYQPRGTGANAGLPERELVQPTHGLASALAADPRLQPSGLEGGRTAFLDSEPREQEIAVYPEDPRLLRLRGQIQAKYGQRISLFWQRHAGELRRKRQTACRTFWHSTWLDAGGQMSPCCVWPVTAFAGDVMGGTASWNSPRMIRLRASMRRNVYSQICSRCCHLYDDPLDI